MAEGEGCGRVVGGGENSRKRRGLVVFCERNRKNAIRVAERKANTSILSSYTLSTSTRSCTKGSSHHSPKSFVMISHP